MSHNLTTYEFWSPGCVAKATTHYSDTYKISDVVEYRPDGKTVKSTKKFRPDGELEIAQKFYSDGGIESIETCEDDIRMLKQYENDGKLQDITRNFPGRFIPQFIETYDDGILHSILELYENNTPKKSVKYDSNKQPVTIETFHPEPGRRIATETYVNGRIAILEEYDSYLRRTATHYDSDGRIKKVDKYRSYKVVGSTTEYAPNGTRTTCKFYDSDGALSSDVTYDVNGRIATSHNYNLDGTTREIEEYYPNGQHKYDETHYPNENQATFFTFYSDGVPETSGRRNPDGTVEILEKYDTDGYIVK